MAKKIIDAEILEDFIRKFEQGIVDIRNSYQTIDEPPVDDNEPEEPIEPSEPTEPEEPTPDPEPEEPISDDPVSNFKVTIIAPNMVRCTWTAHEKGTMDIEFYRPGVDTKKDKVTGKIEDDKWKHTVAKYKELFNISDQSIVIGVNPPIEGSLYRPKVGSWTGEVVKASQPKQEPTPTPVPTTTPTPVPDPINDTEPIPVPQPQPETPTEPSVVDVGLVFLSGESFDVWVNGKKVKEEFDYTFPKPDGVSAGVKIVSLQEVFKTLVIDKSRTEQAIKVVNRDPDNDLSIINANHTSGGDPNFWGQPSKNKLGIIYGPKGDTVYGEDPDPEFWKGWAEDPNKPDYRVFHPQWSSTGKIVISFLS